MDNLLGRVLHALVKKFPFIKIFIVKLVCRNPELNAPIGTYNILAVLARSANIL